MLGRISRFDSTSSFNMHIYDLTPLSNNIMTEEKRGWRMDEAYITLVLGVDLHPPSKVH